MILDELKNRMYFDAPDDGGAGGDNGGEGGDELTPEQMKEEIKKLRNESAKYRTRSKDFDSLKSEIEDLRSFKTKVSTFLGGDDKKEDPEKALKALQEENKRMKLERTVSSAAKKNNADEELVSAYLSYNGLLNDVDPSDEKAISELIKSAVESNKKLLAGIPTKTGDTTKPDGTGKKVNMNDFIRRGAGR